MCGIAGIIDYDGRRNTSPAVKSMLQSIKYRGPDESGIFHSKCASIGSVRLSIIDIETGQQPLADNSGRFWIVFNGEIFNYKELREELQNKGLRFKTESDTEVLVQLYAIHGKECLTKLNGQFAIAIWDRENQELFLARDRVGIRPLFYNITNGVLTFASEIKALFSQNYINREFNIENLIQVYTFWSALTPGTPFKDIYELPPGHWMIFNRNGLKAEQYWKLNYGHIDQKISLRDATEAFNHLFTSAVRLRLRADVEVAAYLSGGIDSSSTVAYIKKIEPGILNTFSIGFTERDFDESSYQQEAVRYFDTSHRSINCTPGDIADVFPSVIWHSETPLLRTAPAPMFIISRLVRDNNIKVVITGEGSDEILAGYDIFREAIIRRFWAAQPESEIRPALLKRIYPDIPHLRNASTGMLKMFFGYRLQDTSDPLYSHLLRWNNANHIRKHLAPDLKAHTEKYSPFEGLLQNLPDGFDSWDPLAKAQWLESTIFMSGYLLSSQGDRMAMANSVEGRYPFLDYRLIEFCATLPARYKLNGLDEKHLLKRLVTGSIPESIVRRPKQPYRAPIRSVFMDDTAPEYVKEMLSTSNFKSTGIFDYDSFSAVLNRITKTNMASEVDNMLLTAVISTHLLHHQFIMNHNNEFSNGELRNLKITNDVSPNL